MCGLCGFVLFVKLKELSQVELRNGADDHAHFSHRLFLCDNFVSPQETGCVGVAEPAVDANLPEVLKNCNSSTSDD